MKPSARLIDGRQAPTTQRPSPAFRWSLSAAVCAITPPECNVGRCNTTADTLAETMKPQFPELKMVKDVDAQTSTLSEMDADRSLEFGWISSAA